MATATTPTPPPTSDYFSRPAAARSRPSASNAALSPSHQRSPRTPLLGRSISGQFGSPSSLSREQDETLVYELHPRYLSAGFAGEARPRCVLRFGYGVSDGRRVGDWRGVTQPPGKAKARKGSHDTQSWGKDFELFSADVRDLDFALLEDRLERAVRQAHVDFLQLDAKSRRAVLVIPSLLPTPVLESAVRVLFQHYLQPPVVSVLTTPVTACVGAGLRCGLVMNVGWEETVVTGVGEYRSVSEQRSVRAGKNVVREMARLLEEALEEQYPGIDGGISFAFAEDVTQRLAWCKPNAQPDESFDASKTLTIPLPSHPAKSLSIPFAELSTAVEHTLFASPTSESASSNIDDNELSLPDLVFRTLLSLPVDLRALSMSRIILTGFSSSIPGLKPRLLSELEKILNKRGWDPVHSYGSAKKPLPIRLRERSANLPSPTPTPTAPKDPVDTPPVQSQTQIQAQLQSLPPHARPHDHLSDPLSVRVEREPRKREDAFVKGVVRGVHTLGAWSGASLVAGMRVKGATEVERERFLREGLSWGGDVGL